VAVDSLQISAKTAEPGAARRAGGRPFQKGQSGNPKGRPRGSRNRKTLLAQQLLDDEAGALVRKVLEMALAGDPAAMKLCIDRVVAPRRERAVEIALPRLKTAADLAPVMGAVTGAAATGRITPSEAQALAHTLATAMRAIEVSEFDDRLKEIEATLEHAKATESAAHPAYTRAAAGDRLSGAW
jgi:hypothetical protein